MKVLTKEEEAKHYRATVQGGTIGGLIGVAIGAVGVFAANRRFAAVRALTLPFKTFLVTSSGTFIAVIAADRASARYDAINNIEKRKEIEREQRLAQEAVAGKSTLERAREWAEENRYPIIFAFWIVSMGGSFALVNRNRYLSGTQKLVQARMYAQGATLSVLLASFYFEASDATKGRGRWETVRIIDPNDPEHKHYIEKRVHHERYPGEDQWRDMVDAEEQRMKARKETVKAQVPEKKETKSEAKSEPKSEPK